VKILSEHKRENPMRGVSRVKLVSGILIFSVLIAVFVSQLQRNNREIIPAETESLIQNPDTASPNETKPIEIAKRPKPDPSAVLEKIRGVYISDGKVNDVRQFISSVDHHLADTQQLLSKMETAEGGQSKQLLQLLESKKLEFVTLREESSRILKDIRQNNLKKVELVNQRFDQISSAISEVIAATTSTEKRNKVVAAKQILQKLRSGDRGLRGKPMPTFTHEELPAMEPANIPDAPPPAYARPNDTNKVTGNNDSASGFSVSAFSGGFLHIFGIANVYAEVPPAIPPEAVSCSYTAADLADALPEVEVGHPDIQALAAELEFSPVKIYSWVKNNIEFEPYYGSVKGAVATLKSGRGGATDQASLLIALLRASNIPARYVKGEISFDTGDMRYPNWLGVKTFIAAINRLLVGNHPSTSAENKFVHVWAEACVPYDNYRGTGSDNSGFNWIPLDASFKEMAFTEGPTINDVAGGFDFDYSGYLSDRTTVMPHEALINQMEGSLGGPLVHGGGYRGKILRQEIEILPSTLPYKVLAFKQWDGTTESEVSALPQAHRVQVEYSIKNSSGTPLVPMLVMDMPELVNGRLTLSFKGATTADQTQIENWQQNGGSMPCGYDVHAVFKFDGDDVTPAGSPQSVDICSEYNQLKIAVKRNGTTLKQTEYFNIGGHNYHALQAYGFQASDTFTEERSEKLLSAIHNSLPNNQLDETLGEYLNIVGLKYMGYIENSAKSISILYDETGDSGHHIGLTSTAMRVDYLFDLPFAVTGDGLLIDVPGGSSRSRNISTGDFSFATFLLAGYSLSAYESYIWQEHAHLDAVSTVRGLQYANDISIYDVVELTSASQVDSLPTGIYLMPENIELSYDSATRTALKSLLNGGYNKITLPTTKILYSNWLGTVWTQEDSTGPNYSAGYIISGSYTAGGGYTLNTPVTQYHNPSLGTGFLNQIRTEYVTATTGQTNQIPYTGAGSNTGETQDSSKSGDPVNLVSGNMFHKEMDIYLKGRGNLDLAFERVYNSQFRKDGPLGNGWTHSYNHQLKFVDDNPGDTTTNATESVIWVDGTGNLTTFEVAGTTSGISLNTQFTNPAGTYVIAKREANGEYSIREKNGLVFYFENIAGITGQTAKLLRVASRNGNTLTFNYSGDNLVSVQDGLNRHLTFHYDNADNHITRVEDWSGRTFRYNYTGDNLTSFETPLAIAGKESPTTYSYYTSAYSANLENVMQSFTYPNGNGMTFEYYTNGMVFRHTDSKGQTYTFRYNTFRRETTTIDERGISQTYLFNEYGQQVQHIQGDGSRYIYEYSDTNNPVKETIRRHLLGYETQFEYDLSGDLTKSTLPDGSTQEYFGRSDNAFHLPCTIKDANNNYVLYRYDANGNRTDTIALKAGVTLTAPEANSCSHTPASGDILSWSINTYDSYGNVHTSKQVRDFATQQGPFREYTYDANHLNPVTIKRCGLQQDASGTLLNHCVSGSQTFDSLGRIVQGVDNSFYPGEVEYDGNGRVVRATNALNHWQDFSYDGNGNLVATSQVGKKTDGSIGLLVHNSVTYDELDRPIKQINVAGFTTKTEYDEVGNVLKVTNPDGYSVHFEYDAQNRPTKAFDAHGHAVTTEYDIGGRPVKVTDPNGNSTTYDYYGAEENGRLKKVTTADNRSLEYFYDDNGNVIRTVDNSGRENLVEYDALNRPVRKVRPLHTSYIGGAQASNRQVTKISYNSLGYVTTLEAGYTTNASGAVGNDVLVVQSTSVYDDFGRLLEEQDANSKLTHYFYDSHGNLIRSESANGHIVELSYDHDRNGLLIQRSAKLSVADPNPHITSYSYNALGQRTSVTTPEVTYDYTHDQANRLATVTDERGGKTLSYDRSPGGLLNRVTDSEDKSTSFLYDAANRLTALVAPHGERVNFAFDAGGRLLETNSPNGVSARYQYDAGNKLTHLVNRTSQGIISQHDYGYDTLGRRVSHAETIDSFSTDYVYSYDNLDRLVEVLKDAGSTSVESYQYDQFDNRRIRQPYGGTAHYYQYDAAQQLQSIKESSDTGPLVSSFSYDDSGNLISKATGSVTRTLSYDALDRLVQVQGSDIDTETYKYDHQGRRIEKQVGTTVQRYIYSGMSIWSEHSDNWAADALAHYSYTGLDQPFLRSTPNAANSRYYHQDGLGSAVAVSDPAGQTQGSMRYDAWGNVLAGSGIPQFGFTGREPDNTGFIYYRARYYDPTAGRFMQRDPLGFSDGINPYAYVGNSPANFTDPLGLSKNAQSPLVQASAFPGNNIRQLNDELQAKGNEFSENLSDAAKSMAAKALDADLGGNTFDSIKYHTQGLILATAAAAVDRFWPDANGAADAVDDFSQGHYLGAAMSTGGVILENIGVGKVYKAATKGMDHSPLEGIYEFIDTTGKKYIGQSSNIPKRLEQHMKSGKLDAKQSVTVTEVRGGKTAREVAEHRRIQEITGGVPARFSDKVSNKVDPIGPKRSYLLNE
jgi:RHS repeat-associated protein